MAINFLAQAAQEAPTVFDSVLDLLYQFGFFRVILPFLLVFAIVYGVLLKTGILGASDDPVAKSVSAIIALAIGFFIISSKPVVNALSVLIPQASFLLVVVLFILLMMAFMGFKVADGITGSPWWAYIIAIILIITFMGLIDVATGFQIPVIHSIVLAFMGTGVVTEPSETFNAVLLLLAMLAIPVAIIIYVLKQ
jgi:hypothetical protein